MLDHVMLPTEGPPTDRTLELPDLEMPVPVVGLEVCPVPGSAAVEGLAAFRAT